MPVSNASLVYPAPHTGLMAPSYAGGVQLKHVSLASGAHNPSSSPCYVTWGAVLRFLSAPLGLGMPPSRSAPFISLAGGHCGQDCFITRRLWYCAPIYCSEPASLAGSTLFLAAGQPDMRGSKEDNSSTEGVAH